MNTNQNQETKAEKLTRLTVIFDGGYSKKYFENALKNSETIENIFKNISK